VEVLAERGDRPLLADPVEVRPGQVARLLPGRLVVAEPEDPLPLVDGAGPLREPFDGVVRPRRGAQRGVDEIASHHVHMGVCIDEAREDDAATAVVDGRLDADEGVDLVCRPEADDSAAADGDRLMNRVPLGSERVNLAVRQDQVCRLGHRRDVGTRADSSGGGMSGGAGIRVSRAGERVGLSTPD
jgi:hypothetical protein